MVKSYLYRKKCYPNLYRKLLTEAALVKRKAALIKRINEKFSENYNLNDVVQILSKEVSAEFGFENVIFIELFPRLEGKVRIKSEYQNFSSTNGDKLINMDEDDFKLLTDTIFKNKPSLVVEDINNSKFSEQFKNSCSKHEINFVAFFPLRGKKEVWGLIAFAGKSYRHLHPPLAELLSSLSNEIFLMIKNAKLLTTCEALFERESILKNITNKTLSCKNLTYALNSISEEIAKIFDIDIVAIRLFDKTLMTFSDTLGEYRLSEDIPSFKGKFLNKKELNDFVWDKLFLNYESIIIDDVNKADIPEEIRNSLQDLEVRSVVFFPILYNEEPMATIFLASIRGTYSIRKELYEFLIPIANQLAVCINLFDTNEQLTRSLQVEKTTKELVFKLKENDHHDKIFSSFLEPSLELFDVERALHLHLDRDKNIIVNLEALKNHTFLRLLGEQILDSTNTMELVYNSKKMIWVVNNIETDINNENFKEFLAKNNIQAFLAHYNACICPDCFPDDPEKKNKFAINLICSSCPRIWHSSDIESYRLLAETITLIYSQMAQKKEIEYTKKTFLATLTHDLRSPIIGEQKALEYIISKKPETSLGNFVDFLQDIYYTNEDLLNIVNNILMVYHYESGQIYLNISVCDVKDVIDASIRSVHHLAKEKKTVISINCDESIPALGLDKNQIARVFTNLISNAIKHNSSSTNIDIEAKKLDNEISFSVKDNGKGIAEENKASIFSKYPTRKGQIGTGLGLYLSKQIIEAHNGKIWFETEEDKGTDFIFTIPLNL